MKALVTGGNSFVGTTLIEELDTLGFEVYALLGGSNGVSNLEDLKFQRVDGSLSDFSSLCDAVKSMNYIFHLEETTQALNKDRIFDHNARGTERLAQAVWETCPNLTRFIYVSSLAAGGPARSLIPRVESDLDEPVSYYGKSKLEGERRLLQFKEEFPISIIRPAMVYGPRDRTLAFLSQALIRNLMPVVQGSTLGGHKYYSSIHVLDLCRGLVQAAVATHERSPSGEIFYLAEDGIHTYQDLVAIISERLNCDPLKIRIPKLAIQIAASSLTIVGVMTRKSFALNLDKVNEILSDYWICSNQKAKKSLGFSPEFDLASGVAHAIEWYKRRKWI
jgi:nucleoside-diphosphate-sugar epimerase